MKTITFIRINNNNLLSRYAMQCLKVLYYNLFSSRTGPQSLIGNASENSRHFQFHATLKTVSFSVRKCVCLKPDVITTTTEKWLMLQYCLLYCYPSTKFLKILASSSSCFLEMLRLILDLQLAGDLLLRDLLLMSKCIR